MAAHEATLAANAATVLPLIWGLSSPQAIEKMKADTTTIACPTLSITDSHDTGTTEGDTP